MGKIEMTLLGERETRESRFLPPRVQCQSAVVDKRRREIIEEPSYMYTEGTKRSRKKARLKWEIENLRRAVRQIPDDKYQL